MPASERLCVISVHYGMFLVIAIKLSENYCVAYLYAWNRTTEKDADPLMGQPVSIPRDWDFRATDWS